MPLELSDLNACTRQFMLAELEDDVRAGRLYVSPHLSERGRLDYENLLRAAIETGTEASFAQELQALDRVRASHRWRRIDEDELAANLEAATMLAEREFHRFYLRGLCRRAVDERVRTLVIYRARLTSQTRSTADAMINVKIDAISLLEDLRTAAGVTPPDGLPQCRDTGLSVQFARPVASPAG